MDILQILTVLVSIYLIIGFVYAVYILLFAGDVWTSFPINVIFGVPYLINIFATSSFGGKRVSYKDIFFGKKAVIFDLDGTIIDSFEAWETALDIVKTRAGIPFVPNKFPVGQNIVDDWKTLIQDAANSPFNTKPIVKTPDQLAEDTEKEFLKLKVDWQPIDGFWPFIGDLKDNGFKLALASNTRRSVVDALLDRMNLVGVFDFILCGDEVTKRKPHPEMYKTLVSKLGLGSKDCVIFEDSVVGAEAAVRSGVETVVIWNGKADQKVYPKSIKLFMPDFSDLPGNIFKTNEDRMKEIAEEVARDKDVLV